MTIDSIKSFLGKAETGDMKVSDVIPTSVDSTYGVDAIYNSITYDNRIDGSCIESTTITDTLGNNVYTWTTNSSGGGNWATVNGNWTTTTTPYANLTWAHGTKQKPDPAPDGEMRMYDVDVVETRKKTVSILAEDYDEACDIVSKMYSDDEIQLDEKDISNFNIG